MNRRNFLKALGITGAAAVVAPTALVDALTAARPVAPIPLPVPNPVAEPITTGWTQVVTGWTPTAEVEDVTIHLDNKGNGLTVPVFGRFDAGKVYTLRYWLKRTGDAYLVDSVQLIDGARA